MHNDADECLCHDYSFLLRPLQGRNRYRFLVRWRCHRLLNLSAARTNHRQLEFFISAALKHFTLSLLSFTIRLPFNQMILMEKIGLELIQTSIQNEEKSKSK